MKKPIEYIKEAISIYFQKENFIYFAKIMAVVTLASLIVGFLGGFFYLSESNDYVIKISETFRMLGYVVISLVAFILGTWGQATTYMSIFKKGESEKEIFRLGYKKMWIFFLTSLVLGLIVVGGLILLVIPAIIFGIWYSFTLMLVLDKEMPIKQALIQSKKMVQGNFMKIFGRFILFGLFGMFSSIILSLIPYNIGSLIFGFASPLFILPTILLYRDLVASY